MLCGEARGRVVGVDLATGTVVSDRFDTQQGNVHLLSSDGTTLLGLANEDSYTVWRLDQVGLITHTVSRWGGTRVLDYLPGHDLLLIAGVDPETRNPVVDLVDTHSGRPGWSRSTVRSTLVPRGPAAPSCDTTTARWRATTSTANPPRDPVCTPGQRSTTSPRSATVPTCGSPTDRSVRSTSSRAWSATSTSPTRRISASSSTPTPKSCTRCPARRSSGATRPRVRCSRRQTCPTSPTSPCTGAP